MAPLLADQLRNDPRIAQARELVHEALKHHQKQLTGVRPSAQEHRLSYEKLMEALHTCRGFLPWLPYLGSGLGHGALVELADGSIKYDFISGVGSQFGHSLPKMVDVALDAALDDVVLQGNLMQNREAVTLMQRLLQLSGFDHCFLTTSGAMAGENALKIAFQARRGRSRILAFSRCLVGRTCTLSQITDRPASREGLPLNLGVDYIPFLESRMPAESLQFTLDCLEKHLARYPQAHAAIIMEMIQGEGGVWAGTHEFFTPIMERLKEEDILIIADEVQTFGRTQQLFAYQHFQLEQYIDLVMLGKMAQVCATLWRKPHNPKPGLLSQTFISSSVAIRASLAVLDTLKTDYFGPNGRNAHLQTLFHKRLEQMPDVSGPFGVGTMVAFTPYDGDRDRVLELVRALFDAGVISFICGQKPARIRLLLPAGGLCDETAHTALDIIEKTLQDHSF